MYFEALRTMTMISLFVLLLPFANGHAHIHCHHAESCSNQRLLWTNASDEYVGIHCHGMAACFNSTIRSPYGYWTPNCDAAAACIDLKQHENETLQAFTCGGYYGCHNAWSHLHTIVNTIDCSAQRGCYQSNMYSNYIQCSSLLGCESTNIVTGSTYTSSASVFGYGTLSLYNSIITTEGNGQTVHIKMYGHLSGYGLQITCTGTDNCQLYCYSPLACLNIQFECSVDATCYVGHYQFSGTEIIGMNITSDGGIYEGVDGFDEYLDEIITEWMYLMDDFDNITDIGEDYSSYYEELCGDYNVCKNKYGCENETITVESSSNFIDNEDIVEYYCITGYNAGNEGSFWMGEGIDLVVDGASCLQSGTHRADNIYCRGSDTCLGGLTTYSGVGDVYCNGVDSCKGHEGGWNGIGNLYCLGKDTCQSLDALVGINNIYAFGYYSLYNSVVNSTGDEDNPQTLTVYLGAHKSGGNTVFNCLGKDNCTIMCIDTSFDCINEIDYEFNCGEQATCLAKTLDDVEIYVSEETSDEPPINTQEDNAFTNGIGMLTLILIGAVSVVIA